MDFNWPFRIMESHNEGNKLKLDVDKVEWIKLKGDETRGRGRTMVFLAAVAAFE